MIAYVDRDGLTVYGHLRAAETVRVQKAKKEAEYWKAFWRQERLKHVCPKCEEKKP